MWRWLGGVCRAKIQKNPYQKDHKKLANEFNEYFASVGKIAADKVKRLAEVNIQIATAFPPARPVAEILVGRRPPTFTGNDEFSEILTQKRAKNSLFECKWGGLSEIWKFCRKFRRLCPPPGKSEFPPLCETGHFLRIRQLGGGGASTKRDHTIPSVEKW
jgi:hypothetical protein